MNEELAYWLALAHIPKINTKRKNDIIVRFFKQEKTIIDFFQQSIHSWKAEFELNDKEIDLFETAKKALSSYAFLVEDLLDQGYNILPVTSKAYSPIMKKNLKGTYAPPLIYTKGNLQIMQEKSVAIVGSRKASNLSLEFTDKIAEKASKDYKVVVSGFRYLSPEAFIYFSKSINSFSR